MDWFLILVGGSFFTVSWRGNAYPSKETFPHSMETRAKVDYTHLLKHSHLLCLSSSFPRQAWERE